jgi:hypothetical protein
VPDPPGAHLQHQIVRARRRAQHRQRHTDLVVLRPLRGRRAAQAAQHLPQQILGAGLPAGPGHPDPSRPGRGPRRPRGQRAQRRPHVGNHDRWCPDRPGGQHADRSRCHRISRELVPVRPFPDERREQAPRPGTPGVNDHRPGHHSAGLGHLVQMAIGHLSNAGKAHRQHERRSVHEKDYTAANLSPWRSSRLTRPRPASPVFLARPRQCSKCGEDP